MPLLEIVHYPDPVLLSVGKPVEDAEFENGLSKLAEDMFETMDKAGRRWTCGSAGGYLEAAFCHGRTG